MAKATSRAWDRFIPSTGTEPEKTPGIPQERPERQDLAVGEVDDPHDAEDEVEAAGHQGVDPAQQQPVGEQLRQRAHATRALPSIRAPPPSQRQPRLPEL